MGNEARHPGMSVNGNDAALAAVLSRYEGKGHAYLLPCLHKVQALMGWLNPEVCKQISASLCVPEVDVHGVIEFYTMLYNRPVGRRIVRVCHDPVCLMTGLPDLAARQDGEAGSAAILQTVKQVLGLSPDETSSDGEFTFEVVPCLGRCEAPPVLTVNNDVYTNVQPAAVGSILRGEAASSPETNETFGDLKVLTAKVGKVDPESLASYEEHGGFTALRRALEMEPGAIVGMVDDSGLVGRGGAAFPTGVKWKGAAAQPPPRFVVCNADESEPGTFKDRILMERDPFTLVESMIIAGYAVGAEQGYIYVRGEYPLAYQRLQRAIEQCRVAGYLAENILDTSFKFDLEMRLGAGAYICGEETALFESIEGKRGMPRVKPPFPTEKGLFGRPTVINNVETLYNVPPLVLNGVEWFRALGTEDSPGPKLFCVSGSVRQPGLYEVRMGTSLRELLQMAGGLPEGRNLRGILMGGAAGVFVGAQHLDVSLDFQAVRDIGATLGSGVITVVDEQADLWHALSRIAHFFAHEACGKCYPCQMGTQRQAEIVDRMRSGGGRPDDVVTLRDLGLTMTDASLCGLGQTASGAILSAIELWGTPAEVR